jgi:NADH:ubiquinone oxidoreductase subunit F (NADH-binding)/(2Fe-2S) ferredoxin
MQPQEIDSKAEARRAEQAKYAFRLFGCASTGCLSSGSKSVLQTIKDELTAAGIADQVEIVPTGCMGLCSLGPLVRVEQKDGGQTLYKEVNVETAKAIVREHLVPASHGQAVKLATLTDHVLALDLPFFTRQVRVVLENSGVVDPERLDDYLAAGGYRAIAKVLSTMTPEQVIEEIRTSGLRGRGGAGFPTATKWEITRKAVGETKYAVCNGDEGDPGAYMDRCVLEADPHAVIEGMMIGAYAMGAQQGVFYIRAEYPLAVERVNKAIKDARKAGLLGKNILGSDFSFDCEVRLGAGAFVCGEETALLASIEGRRGTPSPRPPFPSIKGLWGMPTAINNVETLANVARIVNKGGTWFSAMGTERSKGTKVFALTGKVKNSGLVEVPMGMSLRDIVFDIGGGSGSGKAVTIIQTGGPSGGMIPEQYFDTPVSYEHLQKLGSIMGSGGMIVMDESDSAVDLSRFYLEFTVDESCGKCAPCRIGGPQLLTLLGRIAKGEGTQADMKMAKRVALAMQRASLCGLGQTAPNPVLSAMKYFPEDFARRLRPEPKKQGGCSCEPASEAPKV